MECLERQAMEVSPGAWKAHARTRELSHTHKLTHAHTHTLSLTHSHTFTHTHTHTLTLTRTQVESLLAIFDGSDVSVDVSGLEALRAHLEGAPAP